MIEMCESVANIKEKGNTQYQPSQEQEILNRLREEILRANLNLPLILQKYDRNNNQYIFIRDFENELKNRGITLKRDDVHFLISKVHVNELNQINYIEVSDFIMNSRLNTPMNPNISSVVYSPTHQNPYNSNPNFNVNVNAPIYNQNPMGTSNIYNQNQIIAQYEKVKEKIKELYQQLGISLKALFRQIDLDSDNYISFKEFSDCLEKKLHLPYIDYSLTEEVFKKYDDDKDYKISYFEFSKHILNLDGIDHKKLLQKLKKQLLEKTDEENDLLKLFKSMDLDNNGTLSFNELSDSMKKLNVNFSKSEIEDLFSYFDKDDSEKISYEHFVEVLSEDHLNLAPLRSKVNEILKEKGQNLKAYFRSLNTKGEDDFLNKKEFSDFIKKLGFKYDSEQEEEIFEAFDQDKDYRIAYEEFNNMIFDIKQNDISALIKRLRRHIFSQKIDLLSEFEASDKRHEGYLVSFEFNRILKKLSVFSPLEIDLIFKGFADGQRIDYKGFWEALLENNIDLDYIKQKFDEKCKQWKVDYEGLYEEFDQSSKGYLSWRDFDEMMVALQLRLSVEEVQEYFNAFDINKNGKLTKNEFLEVLTGKKQKNKRMMFNLESPKWERSPEYGKKFEFKGKKDGFKKKGGFSIKPLNGFDDEDNERIPMKTLNMKRAYSEEEEVSMGPSKLHRGGHIDPNREYEEEVGLGPSKLHRGGHIDLNRGYEEEVGLGPSKLHRGGHIDDDRRYETTLDKTTYADDIRGGRRPMTGKNIQDFQPMELVNLMKQQAYNKRIPLFQLFTSYDNQQKCILSSVKDLITIISYKLDLREVPIDHIESLFSYYSLDEGKTMNFIRLLMDVEDQNSILIETVKYVMHMQQIELPDVFKKVDIDRDNVWNLQEFASLNTMLKIGMDKNEITRIFDQWDLNHNGFISFKELEKIFNTRPDELRRGIIDSPNQRFQAQMYDKPRSPQKDVKFQYYQKKYFRCKDFIRYIVGNLQEKNIRNIQNLFETNEEHIARAKFLKDLKTIKVNTERQEANEFVSLLALESNPSLIDLAEFDYLIQNYGEIFNDNMYKLGGYASTGGYQNPDIGIGRKPMTNDINAIVQELKGIMEDEGFDVIAKYDRNMTGILSENDLYSALTQILDPCEEIDIFIKYASQNGKISIEELKRIFGYEDKFNKQNGFDALGLGVKTTYQASKIISTNDKKMLLESMKELFRAFQVLHPR